MKRREFIGRAAAGAVAFPALAGLGCSGAKEFDLLIRGGTVFDGSGEQGRGLDVAVKNGRIASIAPGLDPKKATEVIDATGMAVSPGFIDPHTHTDIGLLVNPRAESKIHQGVTTEIGGNCGDCIFLISDDGYEGYRDHLKKTYDIDLTWRDLDGFFLKLETTGTSMNWGTLTGNGSLRNLVVGPYDRPATADEMTRMKSILDTAMKSGSMGLSSGLEYTPSSFADTAELTELSKVVASNKGIYATHMRSEQDKLLEAIEESVNIARGSGASLQISHFKANYRENWGLLEPAIAMVEQAQNELGNVLCDRYPYHASSTGLGTLFPMWAREGTTDDMMKRLADPALEESLKAYVLDMGSKLVGWENVLISGVNSDENKAVVGKTVAAACVETGKEPYEFIRDLVVAERNRVGMIKFGMSEENLKRVLAHPLVVIGSDGNSLAPYGKLGEGNPHPRSYGTFPRVLGKFVREERIMPLETAVRKMSALSAEKFGIADRGYLREGYRADIVVFDPDTVVDKATWSNPHQYPEGIPYVVVNGRTVIREGEHTGETPGMVVRHGQV